YAATIGIAVDYRRRNRSEESLALNVQRLKAYLAKLVVLPRNAKKRTAEDVEAYKNAVQTPGQVVPVENVYVPEAPRAITAEEKKASAFSTLRESRGVHRARGKVAKRKALLAEEAANKAKK
ncbi:60S ribosomal protein L13, partial [Dipsacomyces acuminosporus]